MAPRPGIRIFAPNRLLMVCVIATTLPDASAAVMCVVCALSSCATPALHSCARFESIARRRSPACLRGQALDRHVDEVGVAARSGAIGEGDLEHFCEVMNRRRGAEAELCDIVAFENVEHLRDVHAGGR